MQRCDALLIRICRIERAGVEELLYRSYLAQPRQLHEISFYGQAGLLVAEIFQLDVLVASAMLIIIRLGRHCGGGRGAGSRRCLRRSWSGGIVRVVSCEASDALTGERHAEDITVGG
jgi:hypothetical protein